MEEKLSKIRTLLNENNLDAAFISSLTNIVYLTNFSYFTDIEREGYILVTKKSQYIFTDARYSHAVQSQLKNFILKELSGNETLTFHLQEIITNENITVTGIEENNITIKEFKNLNKVLKKTNHFSPQLMRIQKTTNEILAIKKACAIGDNALSQIVPLIKIGMTEKEIAFLLENAIRKQGAEISFESIIAIEENAAVPHHKTGKTKLKKNNLILVDFGVKYQNYCSDMTRTFFFGKPTEKQKHAYETVLHAQTLAATKIKKLLKEAKPIKAVHIDKTARDYILSQGYPSIPHSLGHGIGLQVHEAPRLSPLSKDILSEGMVFSIEPGIYLPVGRQASPGFGIRIEDLFAIQNGKLIQLTKSPNKLLEV